MRRDMHNTIGIKRQGSGIKTLHDPIPRGLRTTQNTLGGALLMSTMHQHT